MGTVSTVVRPRADRQSDCKGGSEDGRLDSCRDPYRIRLRRFGAREARNEGIQDKTIFVGCGRCSYCKQKRAAARAARVLDYMDALCRHRWRRGMVILVTLTLDAKDGPRRGKAGRARLQAGLARLKSELRRQIPRNRFGRPLGHFSASMRCYELHADGQNIHAHLALVYEGRPWCVNPLVCTVAAGTGFCDVSVEMLNEKSIRTATQYAGKYVLKAEPVLHSQYKGTRWYHIWSKYHRSWVPPVTGFKRWPIGGIQRCSQIGSIKVFGRSYPAPLVARWCMSSRNDLIHHSAAVGLLPSLKSPPPLSSVLLR